MNDGALQFGLCVSCCEGCNLENWAPIVRVSNAFPLSGARQPESTAKESSAESPSSQGGCLNRFAIADAAARAAPAVVNVKVSIGEFSILPTLFGCVSAFPGSSAGPALFLVDHFSLLTLAFN